MFDTQISISRCGISRIQTVFWGAQSARRVYCNGVSHCHDCSHPGKNSRWVSTSRCGTPVTVGKVQIGSRYHVVQPEDRLFNVWIIWNSPGSPGHHPASHCGAFFHRRWCTCWVKCWKMPGKRWGRMILRYLVKRYCARVSHGGGEFLEECKMTMGQPYNYSISLIRSSCSCYLVCTI